MNESNTIKELINQAKNTKNLIDQINKAYIGLTVDELLAKKRGAKIDAEVK